MAWIATNWRLFVVITSPTLPNSVTALRKSQSNGATLRTTLCCVQFATNNQKPNQQNGGDWIASCHDEQTAKRITKAVNSHQELLEALQDLLSEFKSRTALIETCDLHDSETNAMEKAEEAIAHATGE